ncbi:DUF2922 domain-containing protein [Selenomonas ruminantium]|uniref:DUF2922 domain-containing protein n=1 Tax=Selenomonas ruminantium TaxID=971 RepID=A0A1H3Z3K7_SELRU|nr:DUF2922 domain-containing protein [Selenomonas ruminantium]SEA18058.1 Protein of unknown function [Selenomonas ruminantium]
MKSTLVMEFKTEGGKNTTISITSPRADLTAAEVNAVANEIVTKKAFVINTGAVVSLENAFIRTVEETALP